MAFFVSLLYFKLDNLCKKSALIYFSPLSLQCPRLNVDEWELRVHVNALLTSIQPFLCSPLMTHQARYHLPQSQKANNSGNISLAPVRMAQPGLRKAPKLLSV